MKPNLFTSRSTRQITKALSNLGNPAVPKNVKRYIASQGQIARSDIKPSILNAIRNNKNNNPHGARGHFFFWGNNDNSNTKSRKRRGPKERKVKTLKGVSKKPCSRKTATRKVEIRKSNNKSKQLKKSKGHREGKRIRLSELMKYSGMKLKNGKRLIVLTTDDDGQAEPSTK
ncbi:hypothetical protein ElyMa_004773100 [Elysia marginata]|uniref:H15 domain-containing protein n=1 Tax=Elysia marginata TaxID=1093978 RepID=A0AAV4IGV3_9GAST|nr:hypothetical protein ElyMa_004773100 [Elysia marginata]